MWAFLSDSTYLVSVFTLARHFDVPFVRLVYFFCRAGRLIQHVHHVVRVVPRTVGSLCITVVLKVSPFSDQGVCRLYRQAVQSAERGVRLSCCEF